MFSQQLAELHRFQLETLSFSCFYHLLWKSIAVKTCDGNSKNWYKPLEVVFQTYLYIEVYHKSVMETLSLHSHISRCDVGPMTSSLPSENVTFLIPGSRRITRFFLQVIKDIKYNNHF